MHTKRLALTVAALALAFCGCAENDWQDRFHIDAAAFEQHADMIDFHITNACDELRQLVERRDALVKRIESDKLADSVREDLKIRRSAELTNCQKAVDELEDYVDRCQDSVDFYKKRFARLQFDHNNPEEAKLIDSVDRAEQLVNKAQKRLAAVLTAWAGYQQGEPLPAKM